MRPYFIAVVGSAAASWPFARRRAAAGDAGSRGPRQRVQSRPCRQPRPPRMATPRASFLYRRVGGKEARTLARADAGAARVAVLINPTDSMAIVRLRGVRMVGLCAPAVPLTDLASRVLRFMKFETTAWLTRQFRFELVSASKFPANREINKEIRSLGRSSAELATQSTRNFNRLRSDSLSKRTGNFLKRAGK